MKGKISSEPIFGNRYSMSHLIGAGSFGQIYSGEDKKTKTQIALKLEAKLAQIPQLAQEAKIYQSLPPNPFFPKFYLYEENINYHVLILELLGKSLENLIDERGGCFSLKTVLLLADQMLSCVQFLHENHFIHRDLKPANFCIGKSPHQSQIFLIDLGLAKNFQNPETKEHISQESGHSLVGTARYASVHAMAGLTQSRRDDLESLCYIWIYLLKGKLPWMGLPGDDDQKNQRIFAKKSQISLEELCSGTPIEIYQYLKIVRSLKFKQDPPYDVLHDLLNHAISKIKNNNSRMDWDEIKIPIEPVTPPKLPLFDGYRSPRTFRRGSPTPYKSQDSNPAPPEAKRNMYNGHFNILLNPPQLRTPLRASKSKPRVVTPRF